MTVQSSGRRTESLFDNRYRYDHIYPRGRSGETLRAYDTHDNNRPVVIKRPAPQDAPPMRAGQEVSIRTEKQALERLSGHPVLTELRGSGIFRVGGHSHDYIVMDRAQGEIVENLVLENAVQGKRLSELEVLVVVDHLLDLLAYAHDRQVIYNDVDAKHLFWDRAAYQLKVIDWGNAVFTDEPGALPTVTRSTDIYQVGELLYFIFTGGNRLAVEMQDSDSFFVNFGPAAETLPARLQGIITRAVQPDPRRRYSTMRELRHALTDYRQPLEKTRDDLLARVRKRIRPTASQEELVELREALRGAAEMDPGHPDVAALAAEIEHLLGQIRFQADLDAIRIYLESGNWTRALALLNDLLPHTDPANEPLARFLIAAAGTLEELRVSPPPACFLNALTPLFQGDTPAAGHILLTTAETRPNSRQAQWMLAEQLAVMLPDVILLRPHLVHLRQILHSAADTGALALLDQIDTDIATTPLPGLTGLAVIYQQTTAALGQMEERLNLSPAEQETALAIVIRARRAAHEVVNRLEAVGHHVYSNPTQAGELLRNAAQIDPTSPHFAALHDYFDEVHQAITALAQFKPRSDGTNLNQWFADVQHFIQPFLDDIPDPKLHAAAQALQQAAEGWTTSINYFALGRRQPTIKLLRDTADVIRPFNEQIAAWLGALANRLPDAPHAEQLSPNQALAEKLIDGWKAWDRGDGPHAVELARQAYDLGVTDGERMAANRLRRLAELVEGWLANHGYEDAQRTSQAANQTLAVLLTDENHERQLFDEQMPNATLYLRAMGRGIVAYMQQSSSAGWRTLYLYYTLQGMLALLNNELDHAEFWRNAASRSMENARTHRAFQVLDRALTARVLVQQAQQAINAVVGPKDLEAVRSALNAPLAGELLSGAQQATQLAQDALRSWSDGDFYAARQALDTAVEQIHRAVETAQLQIETFVIWLSSLRDAAAELHQVRLTIEQAAVTTREDPDPAIGEAHARIVRITLDKLGPDHAHQVRQWDDMYRAVLETYTSPRLNQRERLAAFDRHFASLFISRHPAYPLFRHWQSLVAQMPPDEIEVNPVDYAEPLPLKSVDSPAYLDEDREPEPEPELAPARGGDLPWNWIIAGAVVLLIAAVIFAVMRNRGQQDEGPSIPDEAATETILGTAPVTLRPTTTQAPVVVQQPTAALTLEITTPAPTTVPTLPEPTATSLLSTVEPSLTPTVFELPTQTPTLFVTSTLIPSDTPVPVTETAGGSNTNILAALAGLPENIRPGPAGAFTPAENGSWTVSTAGSSGPITIPLPPELISTLFQPGAANTMRRVDAVMELARYDAVDLNAGNVSFGLGAENRDGDQTIGQVQFIEASFVSLGLNQNGSFRSSTQYPQQSPQITLSVRRSNTTTISFFVDDRWLGDSVFLFPQGEPVTLVLFVSGKDVLVNISAFKMDFVPRDEIP
jgi:hypothetical protein